jgi:hypothetical protein
MSIYRFRSVASLVALAIVGGLGIECSPNACLLESDCSSGLSCVAGKCVAAATDASADAMTHKDAASDSHKDAPPGDGSTTKREAGVDARADSETTSDARRDGPKADSEADARSDAEKARDGALLDAHDDGSTADGGATSDAAKQTDGAMAHVDARHD